MPSKDQDQTTQPESRSRIVITFTDGGVTIQYEGPVNAYMMLGASGVIEASARQMMEDASRMQRENALEVARDIPSALRRQ